MFGGKGGYSLSDIAAVTGNNQSNGWGDGDGWWIIILLLFAFGGWGNGNGFGNNGGGTVREEISYGFDMNGLESGVRGIQQGLCDGFYAVNTGMLNGFSGVQSALCQGFSGVNAGVAQGTTDVIQSINAGTVAGMQNTNAITAQLNAMSADNAACCCDLKSAIASGFCDVNYNMATQANATQRAIADSTRDIIESNNAGTRAILDFLTQDKIAALTAENQTLKFAASQANQNVALGAMMDANTAEILRRTAPIPVPAYLTCPPYGIPQHYGFNYGYGNTGCCTPNPCCCN